MFCHSDVVNNVFSSSSTFKLLSDNSEQQVAAICHVSCPDISEAQLDAIYNFPNCGYKSMWGHLLCKSHKVQEKWIREAKCRVVR